jgi:hypothetical protein
MLPKGEAASIHMRSNVQEAVDAIFLCSITSFFDATTRRKSLFQISPMIKFRTFGAEMLFLIQTRQVFQA